MSEGAVLRKSVKTLWELVRQAEDTVPGREHGMGRGLQGRGLLEPVGEWRTLGHGYKTLEGLQRVRLRGPRTPKDFVLYPKSYRRILSQTMIRSG